MFNNGTKIFSISIIIATLITASMIAFPVYHTAEAGRAYSAGCAYLNEPARDMLWAGGQVYMEMWQGETITIHADYPISDLNPALEPTAIYLTFMGHRVATASFPGTITFAIPDTGMTLLNYDINTPNNVTWTISCGSSLAGSDMVTLPAGSVVGTFVATTPLYYLPAADALSDSVMTVGQSLWVTGLSADGLFYQVILSGQFLWAPVETMGPNYDDVWNGTPLPTQVVD